VKTRLTLGAAAAVAAALALLLGGAFRGSAKPAPANVLPSAVADQLERGFAAGDTKALVAGLQAELRVDPGNVKAYETLGLAYQQRARETGDPSYYPKAEGVLRRALALQPDDLIATAGLGQLALARHRFREALQLGRRARRISPTTGGVYGVIGDAQLELGRYPQAFRAFDRFAAIKPGVASYARVSYARELLGHVPAAEQAMRAAVDASIGEQEAGAWTRSQLGLLYLSTGRARLAARTIHAALELFPNYYLALDAMAQAQASLGHLRTAIEFEQSAVERIPLPQYVGFLGDLYHVTGQTAKAKQEYALISVIERVLAANGVKNDIDVALFDVDHGIRLSHALALARRGYVDRPSIFGDDVLGWALARNGHCTAALHYSERSLRLGTHDALKLFHRGWIAVCLGRRTEAGEYYARALALNPRFSVLWAPVARKGVST
jgi:tetratricopeptide (TPR) repeat protein